MKFSATQLRTLGNILRDAAQAEILPRFRNLDAGAIRHKSSPLDLVTDADEAAERRITADLARAFPGAVVVGEEATAKNEGLVHVLATAELAIVVDPIDGTKNFASGLPLFGVMASVVAADEVIAGAIYDPIAEDWVYGLRGEGAWLEHVDGKRFDLSVAKPPPLGEMLGLVSWMFLPEPLRSTVTRNLSKVAGAANYRTAAHEYRLVAAGHYDFCMYGKLLPWDHAAGVLIHAEAGGYSARFDGTPYRPSLTTGGLLCAADRAAWEMLRAALLDAR
jgi:fructose-1,6-bisphosphatase/inositol monophosphatase family enzyme